MMAIPKQKAMNRPLVSEKTLAIPVARLDRLIYEIRGQKVMLSTELAELYGVQPKALIQAVKRNIDRFPNDFMFQLTRQEVAILKSQIVTASGGGARRAAPYAFTMSLESTLADILTRPRQRRFPNEQPNLS